MVFAPRVVEAIARGKDHADPTGAMRAVLASDRSVNISCPPAAGDVHSSEGGRDRLQRAMTEGAGVLRSAESLARTTDVVAGLDTSGDPELDNLATVALGLLAAATTREESRGAHSRTDFPETSPAFQRRLVLA
jgi:L-aspartate oxidase